jgi:hypothetical protein
MVIHFLLDCYILLINFEEDYGSTFTIITYVIGQYSLGPTCHRLRDAENFTMDQLQTFMKFKTKIIHQREKIPRIKKQGFPVHYPFKDFKARYVCINIKNRFKIPKDEKEGVR